MKKYIYPRITIWHHDLRFKISLHKTWKFYIKLRKKSAARDSHVIRKSQMSLYFSHNIPQPSCKVCSPKLDSVDTMSRFPDLVHLGRSWRSFLSCKRERQEDFLRGLVGPSWMRKSVYSSSEISLPSPLRPLLFLFAVSTLSSSFSSLSFTSSPLPPSSS